MRLTRIERAAQARRRRALEHLDRVRSRADAPSRRAAEAPTRSAALLAFGAAALLGAWLGAGWGDAETIRTVAVRGAEQLSPAAVAGASGVVPGAAAGAVDPEAVAARLAAHPWIHEARALLLPGGRLVLDVGERRAAAVLAGEPARAVDAEGVAFAPLEDPDRFAGLPRLVAAEPVPEGEADARLASALALASGLEARALPRALEIGIAAPGDPLGFTLRLEGVAPQFVLGRNELEERLDGLARLLGAGLAELARAERVDLRFRGQAVLEAPADAPPPTGAAQAATSSGGAASSNARPTG